MELERARARIEGRGARLMAISVDAPEAARALARGLGLRYSVLTDADLAITKAYGVVEGRKHHPRPATFVIDADRKVRFVHVGAHAGDRPSVDALVHAAGA